MLYLIEQFKENYDLVIYDPPHLLNFTDVNFLATHTDGLLMVVGIAKTHKSSVKKTVKQIEEFNLPTLGIVANH